MSNVVLDRLCARMLSAALILNEASDGIEGRDAISRAELHELKRAIDGAARSLNLCSAVLDHCADDALTPGTTAEAIDKRAGADFEAHALNVIRTALAGEERNITQ